MAVGAACQCRTRRPTDSLETEKFCSYSPIRGIPLMSAGRNAKRSAAARALRPIRRGIGATSVELPEGPWSTLGEWAVDRFGEAALADIKREQ